MNIKQTILDYIVSVGGGVTFVELCNHVDGFRGDKEVGMLDANIVFWHGISTEASTAIGQLSAEKKIKVTPTSPLCYIIDGGGMTLPIAKKARSYKKPHWLPVVFNLPHQDGVFLGGITEHE